VSNEDEELELEPWRPWMQRSEATGFGPGDVVEVVKFTGEGARPAAVWSYAGARGAIEHREPGCSDELWVVRMQAMSWTAGEKRRAWLEPSQMRRIGVVELLAELSS